MTRRKPLHFPASRPMFFWLSGVALVLVQYTLDRIDYRRLNSARSRFWLVPYEWAWEFFVFTERFLQDPAPPPPYDGPIIGG